MFRPVSEGVQNAIVEHPSIVICRRTLERFNRSFDTKPIVAISHSSIILLPLNPFPSSWTTASSAKHARMPFRSCPLLYLGRAAFVAARAFTWKKCIQTQVRWRFDRDSRAIRKSHNRNEKRSLGNSGLEITLRISPAG